VPRLVHLIDSYEYVRSNCWQHQIYDALKEHFGVGYAAVTLQETLGAHVPECDVVLSTLKLRTVYRNREQLKEYLGGKEVCVYDQDPWEAFIDQGSFLGAYEGIDASLNVRTFINTSKWWSDYVDAQGMLSEFVRMWPKVEYCSSEPAWRHRPVK